MSARTTNALGIRRGVMDAREHRRIDSVDISPRLRKTAASDHHQKHKAMTVQVEMSPSLAQVYDSSLSMSPTVEPAATMMSQPQYQQRKSGPARQIHRNRASYSCHSCRRRKVKCDRQHPSCGNCSKMLELCTYSDNTGKGSKNKTKKDHGKQRNRRRFDDDDEEYQSDPMLTPAASPKIPPPPPVNLLSTVLKEGELDSKVTKLAEIVDHWYREAYAQGSASGLASPPMSSTSSRRTSENWSIRERSSSYSTTGSGYCTSPSGSSVPSRRNTMPSAPVSVVAMEQPQMDLDHDESDDQDVTLGYLSIQPDGASRHVGSSFWALLSDEISDADEVLKATTAASTAGPQAAHGLPSPSSGNSTPNNGMAGSYPYSTPFPSDSTLLSSLPPQPLSDRLYHSFLTNIHPLTLLVNIQQFTHLYSTFWSLYSSPNIATFFSSQPTFLPLLFAVLYAGSLALPASPDSKNITQHLYSAATSALATSGFPNTPTLNTLVAYLLLNTPNCRAEDPIESFAFLPTAWRVALSMGLHRDGRHFNLPSSETEVRRRVWWLILYLDIRSSLYSGIPPISGSAPKEDVFDTGLPNDSEDIAVIAAVGRYEATLVIREVLGKLFGIRAPGKKEVVEMGEKVFAMKRSMDARIARLVGKDAVVVWARTVLSLEADYAYLLLYLPFVKRGESKLWMHARQCAIKSSHSLLRKHIHLSRTPSFQGFHWFHPSTSQPLHALTILLLDLSERPCSPEAQRSRTLVDECFTLFEGDKVAWTVLNRMRQRGWERYGLDPNGLVKAEETVRLALNSNFVAEATPVLAPEFVAGFAVEGNAMQVDSMGLGMELKEGAFDWDEWDHVFGSYVTVDERETQEWTHL